MRFPRPLSLQFLRPLATGVALTALLASSLGTPAQADPAVTPVNDTLVVTGAGWGHGIGMSQYGARGAAEAGLKHEKILAFYYPGTKIAKLASGTKIRVWISADNDNAMTVLPAKGLAITDSAGTKYTLPTGSRYTQWRLKRSGSKRVLQYRNTAGTWVARSVKLNPKRVWTVENKTRGYVTLRMPNGQNRNYRQQLKFRFYQSGARTVNSVTMENYLRGVVPREMPTSWAAEGVQAQAVAARSYAARMKLTPRTSIYDLCDTAACQVYGGMADETGGGNAAVAATSGQILKYGSAIALTMYSSSNGGHSASGGTAYLKAKADPYDGRTRNQKWSKWLSAAKIQAAYPSIGTLRSVQVKARDGKGPWGGRADQVTIKGSKATVTVSGGSFKSKFGLKERLFGVFAGLKPGTGNHERWQALGGTTSWVGAPTANEASVASGLFARFQGADLYWSKATGSHYLTGKVASTFRSSGGPSSALGFPTTDVTTSGGRTQANFQGGSIQCTSTCKVNTYG
ncbi:MAG: SpoIID/LytB domain-containing protein [Micropruina sp.]|nr:SpoIID/LytB domain-containing protein [Micropruina sp.]